MDGTMRPIWCVGYTVINYGPGGAICDMEQDWEEFPSREEAVQAVPSWIALQPVLAVFDEGSVWVIQSSIPSVQSQREDWWMLDHAIWDTEEVFMKWGQSPL